jgi:CheY-like chemotaxis protein
LRSFGTEAFEAADGAAALEVLSIRGAEFIITDFLMSHWMAPPSLGPFAHLEHDAHWTHIPALSGHADVSKVRAAFAAGASDFIVKPVVPSDLKWRLERLVPALPHIVRTANYHRPSGGCGQCLWAEAIERPRSSSPN